MKNTITTSETFKYMLVFTFLFAAFLALAITYNKAFKQKNEIILILEKYEGVSNKSMSIINNYLKTTNYSTVGNCESGDYGIKSLDDTSPSLANNGEQYLYCLNNKIVKNENGDKIYYDVKIFYKFNIPFVGDLLTFKISGETKAIKLYDESKQKLS